MANTAIENSIAAIETSLEAISLTKADYKSGDAAYKGKGTYKITLGAGEATWYCANRSNIIAQLKVAIVLDKLADTSTAFDDMSNWIEKVMAAVLGTSAPSDAIDVGMPCTWDEPIITESQVSFAVNFTASYLQTISFT